MSTFWLYRFGLYFIDHDSHRYLFSETWRSDADLHALGVVFTVRDMVCQRLQFPFGSPGPFNYSFAGHFMNQIWPSSGPLQANFFAPQAAPPHLNSAAREAALRMQRVGASGGAGKIGRINFPILSDAVFTDLPHRRHVDVATLRPLLATGLNSYPNTIVQPYGTLTNVIWHRATKTTDLVDHYYLQESTTRIWQRWRPFTPAPGANPSWFPPEVPTGS